MKTELELKAGAMALAIQMTEVAHAEILQWKHKVEDLTNATTASAMLQMALDAKTREHTTL
jgi:hypothetical protein